MSLDLLPFGYAPGAEPTWCQGCEKPVYLGPGATHCIVCAKAALKAATDEIDAAAKLNQDREIVTDDLLERYG